MSLWNQITLESLTEKEAASMVQVLPELEQLKLSDIDQNVRKLKEYSFHLPQWVYLVIIIVSVLTILVSIGIIIWKVYSMRGAFKEVKTLLGDKPDVGKVVKAGKFVKNLVTKDISYESSPRTKDVKEPLKRNCTVPKSRAAVDYTLTGIEPHGPSRSVRPIVAPANRSQSYRN